MSKKNNLYLGKAGEFAIISEFLCLGWNVAIPEVDSGDDVFVVRDQDGVFRRVQVKTANGISKNNRIKAQFQINIQQLRTPATPELEFVFIIRFEKKWLPFILISRSHLFDIFETELNVLTSNYLHLTIQTDGQHFFARNIDLTKFVNNFERFPLISH
jgi:hypothetical protein